MADEPEEKAYRLYAGTPTKIRDLPLPAVVQRMEATPGVHKHPRFMVVTGRGLSWKGREWTSLEFLNPLEGFRPLRRDALLDTEVNLLTGRRGDELRGELAVFQRANAAASLPYIVKSLGADPEVFVVDEADAIIPAWTFLPDKKAPLAIRRGYQGEAYWDGFQAEFTTHPGACLAYFVDGVATGLQAIHDAARAKNPKARLSLATVLPVPDEVLETADDKHVEFGCMPSLNAYGLEGNKLPGRRVPFRFAGGHIHFGIPGTTPEEHQAGVKGMDALLGVAAVSMFAEFDNPVRREFYGLPGEYRLPPHGVEYRTLSNAWLMHPVIAHLVYELSRPAYDYGRARCSALESTEEQVVDIIRNSDVPAARAYLDKNRAVYVNILQSRGPFYSSAVQAFKVFRNGAESVIKDPHDFPRNWAFGSWILHSDGPDKNWGLARDKLLKGAKI